MARIPFFLHDLGQAEIDAFAAAIADPIITTGERVEKFERRFADYLGRKHALAVTSCTGALHLSLLGLGIGPGDEVITTPMSFIATATAVLEAGATPVFVDVDPATGNLDPERVVKAITSRTKVLLPVHLYGLMCDMRALREVAQSHGLSLIEDAAHCVEGRTADGLRPGEVSQTACFSFYATKNLTCGEGGALVTDDDKLYQKLRLLRLHGMTKTAADRFKEGYTHWDMEVLGWKYNMSNIDAAILMPQLDRLEENLAKREAIARRYKDLLCSIEGVATPATQPPAVHARHVLTIWVSPSRRDPMIAHLQNEGIGCVVNYRPIHLTAYFRKTFGYQEGAYPNAEKIGSETLSIPFYPTMPLEHVEIVVDAIKRGLIA